MTLQDYKKFEGRKLRVFFKDGTKPIEGIFDCVVPAVDNDPEEASLELEAYVGADYGYTLYESEIERIEYAD